jgi:hypothetical protein
MHRMVRITEDIGRRELTLSQHPAQLIAGGDLSGRCDLYSDGQAVPPALAGAARL